jgi:ankyrin repeat protein
MVRGHGTLLDKLLKASAPGVSLVTARDATERTLLHAALDNRLTGAARYLIDHGADLGAVDQKKRTIFSCAVRSHSLDLVRLLGNRGYCLDPVLSMHRIHWRDGEPLSV